MEDRNRARRPVPVAAAPVPFWQRLRAIVAYPLHGPAGYSLAALTLCSLVAMLLPGLVGLIVSGVIWVGVYRYAFQILRHTADGHMTAPEHSFDVGDGTVLRLLALMIVFATAVVATALLAGPVPALLVMLVLVFLQPGCVISLAIDGSLLHAANPATAVTLALRIGWPYLAAFGLLFVIQTSALTAARWVGGFLPPVASELAVMAFALWGLFAAFHLMGYLVYQYHEALGYAPDALNDPRLNRVDPDQRLLDEAEHHVREGHVETALDQLRAEIRSRAVSLAVHELYQRLLRGTPRREALREHTQQYIARLLHERQERRASALLREALDLDPDFVPLQPKHAEQLVQRARLASQYQLAADMLQAMLRAWPKAAAAPQWALEAALLLAERFGRDDDARALLDQALQRCADDEQRRRLLAARAALGTAPA